MPHSRNLGLLGLILCCVWLTTTEAVHLSAVNKVHRKTTAHGFRSDKFEEVTHDDIVKEAENIIKEDIKKKADSVLEIPKQEDDGLPDLDMVPSAADPRHQELLKKYTPSLAAATEKPNHPAVARDMGEEGAGEGFLVVPPAWRQKQLLLEKLKFAKSQLLQLNEDQRQRVASAHTTAAAPSVTHDAPVAASAAPITPVSHVGGEVRPTYQGEPRPRFAPAEVQPTHPGEPRPRFASAASAPVMTNYPSSASYPVPPTPAIPYPNFQRPFPAQQIPSQPNAIPYPNFQQQNFPSQQFPSQPTYAFPAPVMPAYAPPQPQPQPQPQLTYQPVYGANPAFLETARPGNVVNEYGVYPTTPQITPNDVEFSARERYNSHPEPVLPDLPLPPIVTP